MSTRSGIHARRFHPVLSSLGLLALWPLVLFTPILRVGSSAINLQWIIAPALLCIAIMRFRTALWPLRLIRQQGWGLAILAFWLSGGSIQSTFGDNTGFIWILQAIAGGFAALVMITIHRESKAGYAGLSALLATSAALNSALMCIQLLHPESSNWLSQVLVLQSDIDAEMGIEHLRPRGISGYGGATLSGVLGMVVIIDWVFSEPRSARGWIGMFFRSTLNLIGLTIAGRSGMVVLILGMASLLFSACVQRSRQLATRATLLTGHALLSLSILYLLTTSTASDVLGRAGARAFEFVFRYLTEGSVTTASTDALLIEHLNLPGDTNWFIGSGNFGRSLELEYLASDSGYIRMIVGCGIVGTLMWLGLTLRHAFACRAHASPEIRAFALFYMLCVLVLNIKEPFTLATYGLSVVSTFMLLLKFDYVRVDRSRERRQ